MVVKMQLDILVFGQVPTHDWTSILNLWWFLGRIPSILSRKAHLSSKCFSRQLPLFPLGICFFLFSHVHIQSCLWLLVLCADEVLKYLTIFQWNTQENLARTVTESTVIPLLGCTSTPVPSLPLFKSPPFWFLCVSSHLSLLFSLISFLPLFLSQPPNVPFL